MRRDATLLISLLLLPAGEPVLSAPSQVALSGNGHILAVQAEWTPTTPIDATSKSAVWVAKRLGNGTGTAYQSWTRIVTDQSGDGSVAEFGTTIKVSVAGCCKCPGIRTFMKAHGWIP